MRDQHEVLTSSISPPQKRKRRIAAKKLEHSEPMDYEENTNESLEYMDITEDEESKEKLSDMIDAKVLEKRKRDEEKDMEYIKQRDDLVQKKKMEEEKKTKLIKDNIKKRKQNNKEKK